METQRGESNQKISETLKGFGERVDDILKMQKDPEQDPAVVEGFTNLIKGGLTDFASRTTDDYRMKHIMNHLLD
jgi:hypothetical protein